MAAAVERRLGHLEGFLRRIAEALDLAFAAALLGDLVELAFGALDLGQRRDVLGGVERAFDHVAPDPDQGAQQRQVVDLRGEVAGADDRRAGAGQLGEIGRPADLLHRLVALEHRLQRDRVGDHVLVGHPQDGLVDAAVQRLEEMVGSKPDLDVLDQPVVDHQRAEQRRLRLDILGERGGCGRFRPASDSNDFGHGVGLCGSGDCPNENKCSTPVD